ncbi:MAG: PhzF family phenazine biosynthesis protein [Hyphomonadaceae bacterium]|nr:PhzF family phenazine biosynthesis protein [Hyphomonadaceae bacterium]
MRSLPVRFYASFAAEAFGGNIAGVVYDDAGLKAAEMQRIAADLSVPTTGFVRSQGKGRFHVRFFSTRSEMGMCGHVTVGIFMALCDDLRIAKQEASYCQVTPAGDIPVEVTFVEGRPRVSMKQGMPRFDLIHSTSADIAPMLGVAPGEIKSVASASTALSHLFVELQDTRALASIQPDDSALRALAKSRAVDTLGVWCLQSVVDGGARVRIRDLCHGVGDPEEAASGTTNGALACLLWKNGYARPQSDGSIEVAAEQGFEMGRPSLIISKLKASETEVLEVKVGGSATLRLRGHYTL